SQAAAWLAGWIWTVSTFVPVTLLPATFPSGRLRDRRLPVALGMVALAGMSVGLATSGTIEVSPTHSVDNPLAAPVSGELFLGGSVLMGLSAVVAITGLCLRLRRSVGEDRRRLAPVAVAAVITLPVLLAAAPAGDWSAPIQLVVAPLVPGAITLSVLQYHLYDVEIVVRRSLVFVGLTVLVIGGYVSVVQASANMLDRDPGTLESILATGAVALVFAPARSAMQRGVGRWVYGDRATPDRALADIGGMLTATTGAGPALQSSTARLRDALRLPWVEVRSPEGVLASAGSRPRWAADGLVESFPLVHLGTPQGDLLLVPRSPREPLDTRDRALLAQLGALIAAVLASHRLVSDLQRSRENVVLAREEERRRVRRDLHDGIGPLLSALGTHADVAALRLERDPETVAELLGRIRQIADDAVAGLRRVVDDLQPVGLDELGLPDALHELATTLSSGDRRVQITGTTGTSLPAAVEVAVYRIVAESVSNSLRHGHARLVTVELAREESRLDLEVRDDGTGVSETATAGVGLASMRDRADELGATFGFETSERGTTVRASFPVRST
ncbi:MAG: sensor histidine kinase, partial [Actinomycetota bacterium]|nr:sensor histidine kinase [Actinomycetota bacterium]